MSTSLQNMKDTHAAQTFNSLHMCFIGVLCNGKVLVYTDVSTRPFAASVVFLWAIRHDSGIAQNQTLRSHIRRMSFALSILNVAAVFPGSDLRGHLAVRALVERGRLSLLSRFVSAASSTVRRFSEEKESDAGLAGNSEDASPT